MQSPCVTVTFPFALTRDEPDADVEDKLLKQIDWQLRRLCLCQEPFCEPDRAVLYEILRLHHVQYAHDVYGLPTDTTVRLVNDVKVFHDSIETFGKVKLPKCSDEAFLSEEKEEAGQEEECRRIVDALLAIYGQSVQASDRNLKLLPKRITDIARKWRRLTREEIVDVEHCTGEEEFESVVRRMLLFWATRSRILRHALNDLLDFRFPVPDRESSETSPPPTSKGELSTGCDCWIAVIGHRRAGKTSFMNALTAALMPDESRFDELPVPENFWSRSRARLVMTSAFSRAKSRSDAIEASRDLEDRLLHPWLIEDMQSPTTPAVRNMIEVDTAFLARIRFFDLAGEHMYDDEIGNPDEHVRKILEDRRPVATIIVDDSDPTRTKKEEQHDNDGDGTEGPGRLLRESDRDKYLRLIHDTSAPIYIVVNKCDYFLEDYEGDAEQEMRESLSYSHSETPARHDVEHGAPFIPFVSLRNLDLDRTGPDHQTVIEYLRDEPSLARRPHYQQRVVRDISRLDWLIDGLLERGARDVTLVHLVMKRDGRVRPEQLSGQRMLWEEIETRVVERTKRDRWRALRSLVVDLPVEMERRATKAFGEFNGDWWSVANSGSGEGEQRADGIDSAVKKVKEHLEQYEREKLPDREDMVHKQACTTLRTFLGLLEGIVRRSSDEGKSGADLLKGLVCDLDDTVSFLLQRRRFHKMLGVGIDQFLIELGIDPDIQLKEIGALALVKRTTSAERSKVESLAKDLHQRFAELVKEKALETNEFDGVEEFRRLLGTVVRGASGETDSRQPHESVLYDFREGAKRPFGSSVGSPLLDGSLGFDERDRVSKVIDTGNRTLREAILSTVDTREWELLVESFCNIVQSQGVQTASRYPELMLKRGELDFCRVRVLSEAPLARLAGEFRDKGLAVVSSLLEANAKNRDFEENTIANAAIAESIHRSMRDVPLKNPSDLTKGDAGEDKEDAGEDSVVTDIKDLEGRLSAWLARRYLFKFETKRQDLHEILQKHQDLWNTIDPPSARAIVSGGHAIGRLQLQSALRRISVRRELAVEFQRAIGTVRDFNGRKEKSEFVSSVLDDQSRSILDSARRIQDMKSTVVRDLIHLRIMRRLMISGYAVRYLSSSGWIEAACTVAAKDGDMEVEGELRRARGALARMNRRFEEACTAAESHRIETKGHDIGSPSFDRLAVSSSDAGTRFDDHESNWKELIEALGLGDSGAEAHPLWATRR